MCVNYTPLYYPALFYSTQPPFHPYLFPCPFFFPNPLHIHRGVAWRDEVPLPCFPGACVRGGQGIPARYLLQPHGEAAGHHPHIHHSTYSYTHTYTTETIEAELLLEHRCAWLFGGALPFPLVIAGSGRSARALLGICPRPGH